MIAWLRELPRLAGNGKRAPRKSSNMLMRGPDSLACSVGPFMTFRVNLGECNFQEGQGHVGRLLAMIQLARCNFGLKTFWQLYIKCYVLVTQNMSSVWGLQSRVIACKCVRMQGQVMGR